MEKIRSSSLPVVTGTCDPNKSRARSLLQISTNFLAFTDDDKLFIGNGHRY